MAAEQSGASIRPSAGRSTDTATGASAAVRDRQWFIVGRWQEYAGESRANLLRIIGVGAFYINHLVQYKLAGPADAGAATFHRSVTALAVAWTMLALGILLSLRRQVFPAAMKYISTGADIMLLTAVLFVAGGPGATLVVGYFLILALSALRFSLPLVWCATLGSMAGYLVLLGYAKWFSGGRVPTVPRMSQTVMLLALALCGIVLGQVIRRVRAVAEDYARRVAENRDQEPPPGA